MELRDIRARDVMKAIGMHPIGLDLYVAPDGTSPLVVATPNEHVVDVLDRVARVGGSANVAVAGARSFELIVLEMHGHGDADADDLMIGEDISMGMLSIRLAEQPGAARRLRLRGQEVDVPRVGREIAYA
jgi:hypothetical protein